MGLKRFCEEDILNLSLKHPKHLDNDNQLDSFRQDFPLDLIYPKIDMPGEDEIIKDEILNINLDMADNNFENFENSDFLLPIYPDYFENNFSRRKIVPFQDTYSSSLYSSPTIEIPLGPDHQAELPIWNPKENGLDSNDENAQKLLGICIIPMPDSDKGSIIEKFRPYCSCQDEGSVRCAKQHIKEARQELALALGHEKFVDLGFSDMGEDVALKWTEKEEGLFHEVVFSNPMSNDKKFWEQLYLAFPFRSKMEIVSYYFNVFVLHRRAVQNRSNSLNIDSDDDESMDVECFAEKKLWVDHGDDGENDDNFDENCDDFCDNQDKISKIVKGNFGMGNFDKNVDGIGNFDTKIWTGLRKGADLLPTCHMMEEFFGSSTWEQVEQ